MTKIQIAVATFVMMTAGAVYASAQTAPPTPNPAPGQGQGKKLGPRDGSGPIHTPGTGGGTGAGQRRGRR